MTADFLVHITFWLHTIASRVLSVQRGSFNTSLEKNSGEGQVGGFEGLFRSVGHG